MKDIKKYISLLPILFIMPISLAFVGDTLFGNKDFDLDIEVIDIKINKVNKYNTLKLKDYTYDSDSEQLDYRYDDGMVITYKNVDKDDFINIYSELLVQGLESAIETSLDSSPSINENELRMMEIENLIYEIKIKNEINRMKLEDKLNSELLKKL